MSYTVEFTATAERQFRKLERTIQQRIANTLRRVRVRPHHYARRLVGSRYVRFRAGDYRIIADIRHDQLLVLVLMVGHRSQVYR